MMSPQQEEYVYPWFSASEGMGSRADFGPPRAGDPEQAFKFCIGRRRIADPGGNRLPDKTDKSQMKPHRLKTD
jgi:hypothetical protein